MKFGTYFRVEDPFLDVANLCFKIAGGIAGYHSFKVLGDYFTRDTELTYIVSAFWSEATGIELNEIIENFGGLVGLLGSIYGVTSSYVRSNFEGKSFEEARFGPVKYIERDSEKEIRLSL